MGDVNKTGNEIPVAAGPPAYLPTYDGCYVCGQEHPKGLRIRFFSGADKCVHARFHPTAEQTGYENIVHGGVISALLDELTGWPVSLANGLMAHTAELTVRFLKPVIVGCRYIASARVVRGRGRIWESGGVLRDEAGTVYARSSGTYFLLTADETAAVADRMTYRQEDVPVFKTQF